MTQVRINLEESEIPTHWYNVVADMPNPPAPPLGQDGKPVSPEQMLQIFPGSLLEQEMSGERWIAIPEPVRCKASGEPKTLFFNLSGHGHFDMASYDKYFAGGLVDYEYPEAAIRKSIAHLPKVPA